MRTFYLTVVFEVGVSVEQEEDWLNDPIIAKTIPMSELSKEEIKRIKRTIKHNIVWFDTNVSELGTDKVTQNNNLFTTKCKIATDDIDQAIKELNKYFGDAYGIWQQSDREFRSVPCSKRYDEWPIIYNLDLVLKSVEYKEGEEIDVEKYFAERLAKVDMTALKSLQPTVLQSNMGPLSQPVSFTLSQLQISPNYGMAQMPPLQELPNCGLMPSYQGPNLGD